ncbi:nucleotidyltransferase domain-containing protein [Candidatus Sumerlaeota bacterium]|nr:nucleotidyltransferase domain-containing protein [Candidatus Sumerlaeota bacterium]
MPSSHSPRQPAIEIAPRHLALLKALLKRHAPDAEVWAYGSRVGGGGHDASDLDLVLRCPEDLTKPQKRLAELREALSESNIPILIDLIDWARIPESFRDEIAKDYVVIQEPGAGGD